MNKRKNIKTLVIHPQDKSTAFLEEIYKDKGFEIITNPNFPKKLLNAEIESYQYILLLGHGLPTGLLSGYNLLIDWENVEALRGKNLIGIWCYANQFMQSHNLTAFSTGMFISEEEEADLFQIFASQEQIEQSNRLFGLAVRKNLHLPVLQMKSEVLRMYGNVQNPVIKFNIQQMTTSINTSIAEKNKAIKRASDRYFQIAH